MKISVRFSAVRLVAVGAVVSMIAGLDPGGAWALSPSDALVSNGSPATTFPQNKQNEPALAIDANHPNVLAAGANDYLDIESCSAGDPTSCPFTTGVSISGVYFSFDRGASWTQPTYSGWTARDCLGPAPCTPHVGPIGTVPDYYQSGLSTVGDPAVAFGPVPGRDGKFSWSNGSRLYYSTITVNFSTQRSDQAFKGSAAVAVSRLDAPASTGLTPAIVAQQSNWKPPVIASRQSQAVFADKDQVWADNASSSPFFGHVYVCDRPLRGNGRGQAISGPVEVATSSDGGDTWTQQQISPAPANSQQGFQQGCTVRTDSHGVVYVFYVDFGSISPQAGSHLLVQSFDGGQTWTPPRALFPAIAVCWVFDPVFGLCPPDGVAGPRSALAVEPSVDIANGAPTGAGASNEIVDTWVDNRDGLNNEHVLLRASTDGGVSWSPERQIEQPDDRGFYAAAAISPTGSDLYIAYDAFTTAYRDNTTDPRGLLGVVEHADIAPDGTVGAFSALNRGAVGDPRGSSGNLMMAEFLGDYIYAAATRTYGAGVWVDVRNAADCPAVDAYRMALRTGATANAPAPGTDCPPTFGNSDIYAGAYADPTP